MEERDGLLNMMSFGVETASQMFHRLLIVLSDEEVEGVRYIGEGLGIRCINIGEKLGEGLLEVPARRRPLKVAGLLEDLLVDTRDDRILLDHVEILFDESLRVDPLSLLRSLSRRRLVVVMWRGDVQAGNLVYGVPGHPEYRSYPARDVTLVRFP